MPRKKSSLLRLTSSEKAQIREIQTKVQQLLASSDARVKQLIENIKDEGEKQLNYERRQLESRTQGVEDATRNQKDKNDDFVRKIEDFERVTNGKINDQRNKIYHLKDVLARERLEDRKGQEALKELGRVQGDLNKERSALEIDYNNLLKKRDALDQAKRLELENNKAIVVSEEKKFQEAVNMHRKREQELEDKISRVRSDHAALMAKHRDTAAKLQGGLHNTLAETIGRYNEPYPY